MIKQTYYKVATEGDEQYLICSDYDLKETIVDWLYGMNDGARLTISTVKMTEEEFNNLPEFEG